MLEDVDALKVARADRGLKEEHGRVAVAPFVRVAEVLECLADDGEQRRDDVTALVRPVDGRAAKHDVRRHRLHGGVEVLGLDCDSERVLGHAASSASLTRRSASSLCARRTCVYATSPTSRARRAAFCWSSRSEAFLTRYSPRICFTISSESEITSSRPTPSSAARSSPAISPRYSATLFVATPIVSPCCASTTPSSSSST